MSHYHGIVMFYKVNNHHVFPKITLGAVISVLGRSEAQNCSGPLATSLRINLMPIRGQSQENCKPALVTALKPFLSLSFHVCKTRVQRSPVGIGIQAADNRRVLWALCLLGGGSVIHRVAFKVVCGHLVLIKSGPGNRGLLECGTTHEATSRISS